MADGGGEDRTVKQEGSQRKCVNLASILKLLLKRLICVPAKQGHLHRHLDAPGDFGRGRGAGTSLPSSAPPGDSCCPPTDPPTEPTTWTCPHCHAPSLDNQPIFPRCPTAEYFRRMYLGGQTAPRGSWSASLWSSGQN